MSDPVYMPGDWVVWTGLETTHRSWPRPGELGRVEARHPSGDFDGYARWPRSGIWPFHTREVRAATPDEIAQACMASPEGAP